MSYDSPHPKKTPRSLEYAPLETVEHSAAGHYAAQKETAMKYLLILAVVLVGCGAPLEQPGGGLEPNSGPGLVDDGVKCPGITSSSFTVTLNRDDACPVGARTFDGTLAYGPTGASLIFPGSDPLPCTWSQTAREVKLTCDTPTRITRWSLLLSENGRQLTGSGYSTELGACVSEECAACIRMSYGIITTP